MWLKLTFSRNTQNNVYKDNFERKVTRRVQNFVTADHTMLLLVTTFNFIHIRQGAHYFPGEAKKNPTYKLQPLKSNWSFIVTTIRENSSITFGVVLPMNQTEPEITTSMEEVNVQIFPKRLRWIVILRRHGRHRSCGYRSPFTQLCNLAS